MSALIVPESQLVLKKTSHEKLITEMSGTLRGASKVKGGEKWLLALKAFDFARQYHTGLRKDGRSPEFSHQVFIANYARTLAQGMLYPEETIAAIFLHDICEDYGVTYETIEDKFGKRVRDAVEAMTKKYKGIIIPYPQYFARIAEDPCASIGKGIDRCHNIFTMGDAEWTVTKQEAYLQDILDWFYPMLKKARSNYPEQDDIYENIKTNLMIQSEHINRNLQQLRKIALLTEKLDNHEIISPAMR